MVDQSFRRRNVGTAAGLAAIVLWSTTMAMARSLSEQVGPLTAAAAVYLIAGTLSLGRLALASGALRRVVQLPRAYLWGCGSLFVAYMLVLFLGFGLAKDRSQVLEVNLLNYLWPALTILLSVVILGKRAGWLLIPGALLATAGIAMVLAPDLSWHTRCANVTGNPVAYALGLAAGCFWALYSTLTRRLAGAECEGAVDLFLPATGLMLLALSLAFREPGTWSGHALPEVVGLAIVTWTAYRWWDFAMRHGDIVLVGACSYLTPLLSTLFGCCYLRVSPGSSLWIGCLAIIGGSLLSWRSMAGHEAA